MASDQTLLSLPVRKGLALVLAAIALPIGLLRAEEEPPVDPPATVEPTPVLTTSAVDLPPLPNDEAPEPEEPDAVEPVKIVTLFPAGGLDLKTAELSLNNTLVSQRGVHYQVDRHSDSTWLIFGMTTASMMPVDSSEKSEPIGRAWIGEPGLQFAWADRAESHPQIARALQGAVLVATASDESKQAVALRDSIQWSPMPLDMTRSPARVKLPIPRLPGDIELAVEIAQIESSSPGFQLSESSEPDGLSDRDSAKRPDAALTEVELRLRRQVNQCTLETRFYYTDPSGIRRSFEARDVGRTLQMKKRQLEKSKLMLAKAQRALPGLKRSLSSSLSRRSEDPREQQRIHQATKKLQVSVTRAESLIRKNKKSIPKIAEAVKQMEAVTNVGRGLHRQAKVHACVFAVTSEFRVPIVRVGGVN